MIRKAAILLARQSWFRKFIMSTPVIRELAGRFVGGDDLPSALAAARLLNAKGIKGTLNFHGMHVIDPQEAQHATEQAIEALRRIRSEGIDSHVSVKLTKIGHDISPALGREHLRKILECAVEQGGFVRIDMEESVYVEETLAVCEEMLEQFGNATVGLAVQSYLRNREGDLDRLMDRGTSIRLVKGGYREPEAVVYRTKTDVDGAFNRDIERLLRRGFRPAIATHDELAVALAKDLERLLGLSRNAFEFQMLYGVRPDLQERLVAEGYTVRCYIPYGGDWATHLAGCLRRIPAGLMAGLRRSVTKSGG
jgi:proline dehydrogenase